MSWFFVLVLPLVFAITQDTVRVELVDVRGNRSIPTETIKLYIQTKENDLYSKEQVARDFRAVMAQGFFDEFESRVLIEEGPRGGVIVIFSVKERPIIRDITYDNLKSVPESEVIQRFRERRVGLSKDSRFDPLATERAKQVLAELLSEKGRPKAEIKIEPVPLSASAVIINISVNEGPRVRVREIDFEGNKSFSDRNLRKAMKLTKESSLITIFTSRDVYNPRKLDDDLQLVKIFLGDKGYLRPQIGMPKIDELGQVGLGIPLISPKSEAIKITIPVDEGRRYQFGKITAEGNTIFSEEVVAAVTGIKTGEVASLKVIREGVFERLRKLYGRSGYIQATTELHPQYNDTDGIVDFIVEITEGKSFNVRQIEFKGNTFTRDTVLRREILINEGEPYNQELFDFSRLRLNQLGYFEEIKEEDFQLLTDDINGTVDVILRVKEKGRQTISVSGGASGIGGSFIGLTYSTNNLLGYGESLAFDLQVGNRQRSFSVNFTEPYLRGRPISANVSFFTSSMKFFSDGFFTSSTNGQTANNFDGSLFARSSTGFGVGLSAPLSLFTKRYLKYTRFTRVGLNYSFSTSRVIDPEVNRDTNPANDIPVSFSQPDITTSTITPSLNYNTLNSTLDPTSGQSLSASLNFSGLGGDVRVISPSFEFKFYRPIIKRDKPQVLGMRLLVQHVSSFGKPVGTNSFAFVGGVPIFNRFFLGGEDTLRGYNVRSIAPVARVDQFVTTTNVQAIDVLKNRVLQVLKPGERFRGVAERTLQKFTFNNAFIDDPRLQSFAPIGGDTQLLYNIEYRIPLAGPLSFALFADAGSVFNARTLSDQSIVSAPVERSINMSPVFTLAGIPSSVVLNPRGRIATPQEVADARTPDTPANQLPKGFRLVTFRGQFSSNSIVRLSQDVSGFRDNFRASLGGELRVQIPVIGAPLRFIYSYNPNARTGMFSNEQKSVFRFSIGRTF